jgi:hypothetical protein
MWRRLCPHFGVGDADARDVLRQPERMEQQAGARLIQERDPRGRTESGFGFTTAVEALDRPGTAPRFENPSLAGRGSTGGPPYRVSGDLCRVTDAHPT